MQARWTHIMTITCSIFVKDQAFPTSASLVLTVKERRHGILDAKRHNTQWRTTYCRMNYDRINK